MDKTSYPSSLPLISIVVPVYKVEPYLAQCIESILRQTYSNFELILVDDGSPDRSGAICDEFAKQDSRIRVIHKKNDGVSKARNIGINRAKGEWLCFVDADDLLDSQYLQKFHERIDLDSDYCIQGSFNISEEHITPRWQYLDQDFIIGEDVITTDILRNVVPWGKLFRLDIIRDNDITFNEYISRGEDTLFCIDFLYHTKKISTIGYSGYYYRRNNSNSLSRRRHDPMQLCQYYAEYEKKMNKLTLRTGSAYYHDDREILGSYKYSILEAITLNYDRDAFKKLYKLIKDWLEKNKTIRKEKLSDYLFFLLMLFPSSKLYTFLKALSFCIRLRR